MLALLLRVTGVVIAPNAGLLLLGSAGAALFVCRAWGRRVGNRSAQIIADAAENTLLFVTISLSGALASYGIAALTDGWVDPSLARFDRAIGFDWNALFAETQAHDWMQICGRIIYANIFASPLLLVFYFAVQGQQAAARSFMAAFWLAAFICLILFRWLPSMGPLAFMWHGPITYLPTSGLFQEELITQLREGRAAPVDLLQLKGLVGPPSFHAASAVLYIFAAWRTTVLRWPLTIANLLMLLSVPVEGTHFAADVISGIAVAVASCAAVCWIERFRSQRC